MRYLALCAPLLLLLSCTREREEVSTTSIQTAKQVVVEGVVGGQPFKAQMDLRGQEQAQEQKNVKVVTLPPAGLGSGLAIAGEGLSLAGAAGLLGPWSPIAGLVGMGLTALAGYFKGRKKPTESLQQVVKGVEAFKESSDAKQVKALEWNLSRAMDAKAKRQVRQLR